jgi:hypothetical protein
MPTGVTDTRCNPFRPFHQPVCTYRGANLCGDLLAPQLLANELANPPNQKLG